MYIVDKTREFSENKVLYIVYVYSQSYTYLRTQFS